MGETGDGRQHVLGGMACKGGWGREGGPRAGKAHIGGTPRAGNQTDQPTPQKPPLLVSVGSANGSGGTGGDGSGLTWPSPGPCPECGDPFNPKPRRGEPSREPRGTGGVNAARGPRVTGDVSSAGSEVILGDLCISSTKPLDDDA